MEMEQKDMSEMDRDIIDITKRIVLNYNASDQLKLKKTTNLPIRAEIIGIIKDIRKIMFPGYFAGFNVTYPLAEYFVGEQIIDIAARLKKQIELALSYGKEDIDYKSLKAEAERISMNFIKKLPDIQKMLLMDVQAGFDGDPAAKSKEDIIFSYPGFFAIYVYRLAHVLYKEDVPFIPRIMTEYAHSRTGIDINSGATIGKYFFIDHGTGVVIGETTIIGNYVKLYQGVTIGALSTRDGQKLRDVKRHPTIEDNVTIYSGATVLGGNTVIGTGTVIGGSAFITTSIPPYTKVSVKSPELTMRDGSKAKDKSQWEI